MASAHVTSEMHNPPHPGLVLADTVLHADGGISVAEFAKQLGVARVTLSRVVNARAAISIDLALRLAHALGGSGQQLTGGGSRGRRRACAGVRRLQKVTTEAQVADLTG